MCAKNISRPVEENMIYIYNILHIEKQILYNWSIRVAPLPISYIQILYIYNYIYIYILLYVYEVYIHIMRYH
jgi:hypothetical protein